jgi:phage-related protein (TIGR01555 family)
VTTILDSFRERLSRSLSRVDGWANLLTGVGAQAGATQGRGLYTFQGNPRQGLPAMEALYHEDPDARRIADAVPSHALRPGFKVRVGEEGGGAETETKINGALDDLLVARRVREAWTWSRVHGGGALVLGLDDGQRPEEELSTERLRALRWVVSVTASELWPDTWETDPRSARFGEPVVYRLQRTGGGGGSDTSRVHHTRVIRFEGLITTRTRRNQLNGWGESLLQLIFERLQEWSGAHAATMDLLQQSSVGVYKMRDLMALLGSDPQGLLKARLEAMDLARSVARSVLLDADGESYERTEVGALSGFPDLLDRFSLRLSAATGIPVAILLGRSPAGLNATGDADTRGWDDVVDADRRTVLLPALERVTKLLLLSSEGPTQGVEPEGWSIVLPPLRTSTPTEEAGLRKTTADTDNVYLQAGVLTPEEVASSRFRPEGWSAETIVDLDAREEPSVTGDPNDPSAVDPAAPPPEDAKDPTAALNGAQVKSLMEIVGNVAARGIPRETGVELITTSFPVDTAKAEKLMGPVGRTFFTTPDPTVVAGVDEATARAAKAEASLRGHKAYTARLIEQARAGGLKLGAFTAREPTEVEEGEELAPGDVVAVPTTDALDDVDLTPTEEMAANAKRALEVRAEKPESERGMTDVGIARARDLANRRELSPETVRRMKAFFDRHQGDKDGATWGEQGPGWQAWHGWGGDSGRAWAERKVLEMERARGGAE